MSNLKSRRAIDRFSLFIMAVIPAIAFFSVLLTGLYWGAGVNVIWLADSTNLVLAETPPHAERRTAGLIAVTPALAAWLYALWNLFQMFRDIRKGAIFNIWTIRRLRAYSLFSALTALFTVAGSGARRWAQGEFSDMPLWTHIQISIEHWLLAFTALIFYFVACVLEWAKEYKEEAESYV